MRCSMLNCTCNSSDCLLMNRSPDALDSGAERKAAKAEMLDYIHAPNSERGKYSSFGRDFDDFRYHFSDDDEEL